VAVPQNHSAGSKLCLGVRAKSGLNRAILDQGWSEFRRQLGYKLAWRGGELVVVPPHFTSQTCPASGHVSSENRRTQAEFVCVECAYREHADLGRRYQCAKGGTRPDRL
jgi:putative transposase